ncbi:MAG: peptidase S13 [Acidobacteria bacterium]|nr:MAG: peptidase S13 [Acidobacteriota bacterium]
MVSSGMRGAGRRGRYAVLPALLLSLLVAGAPAVADTTTTMDDAGTSTATAGPDDASATTSAPPTTQAQARPRTRVLTHPLGQVADGPEPDGATLTEAISDELDSDWLGPARRRAVTVRDALTGDVLASRNADRPVTPASTAKLLSAAAIVTGLPVDSTFTTRVVRGAEPGQIVLVAGGDMLLARGEGDPDAVAGRAGVGDLAAQAAEALQEQGVTGPVEVALDLQHVAGPHALRTWTDYWVSEGYTGRIVQIGLEEDRALPQLPSPRDPEQEAARAFVAALEEHGVEVADGDGPDDPGWDAEVVEAPAGAEVLASVESAPVRDVLALALATSDNAMVEQLARQAAVAAGRSADQEAVTAWIVDTVEQDYGIDMTGLTLADASGLSGGTRLTVDVVAEVLVDGADGSHPALQSVLAAGGLPIAGYTGTLHDRFHLPVHAAAVGNARAKTGSLPHVTSLAGTVVTADGRLLVYAMTADDIGEDGAVLEARSSLDEVVAQLARCGC